MSLTGITQVKDFKTWETLFSHQPFHVNTCKIPPQADELSLKQIHSSLIVSPEQVPAEADGFFTEVVAAESQKNSPLVIQTADCLPVTLVNLYPGRIAATHLHAGWRGYAKGIVKDGFSLIWQKQVNVQNTFIYISPAIFGESYECGKDVEEALKNHWERLCNALSCQRLKSEAFALIEGKKTSEKIFPDLQLLCALEAVAHGVPPQNIAVFRKNTYTSAELASYRRACHQSLNEKQRMFTRLSFRHQ